jgi:6-phosphofructokinase 1
VQLIAAGRTGLMVALRDGNYGHAPCEAVLAAAKHVDVDRLYDCARYRARLAAVEGMPMFLY